MDDYDQDGDRLERLADAAAYGLHEKSLERIKSATELAPLQVDEAFGDRLSLFNGTVAFDNSDIAIPGNSKLPVELRRKLAVRDMRGPNGNLGGFGEWDLDVPHLSGTFVAAVGWKVGSQNSTQRCDVTQPPKESGTFMPHDFWDGYHLYIPGQGSKRLLHSPSASIPAPGNGTVYPWITKDMWRISCKPTTANSYGGQGFIATSPGGVKYHLDWAITKEVASVSSSYNTWSGAVSLPRNRVYFVVTRIEDAYGNWVNYAWSGGNLQSISSSDGRSIAVTYSGANISSATSSAGNWSYTYAGGKLSEVTMPDSRKWKYASTGAMEIYTSYLEPIDDFENDCPNMIADVLGNYSIAVTHPAGAKATFAFQPRMHFRTNVPRWCTKPSSTYEYWEVPHNSVTLSLVSKTVTGPLLSSMAWTYAYNQAAGPYVSCTSYSELCQSTTGHVVTGPEGTWSRSYFGVMYGVNEGMLIKEEVGTGASGILRTHTNTYSTSPTLVGVDPSIYWDAQDREVRPLKQSVINQQGVNFTYVANTFDAFARPLSVTRSSTGSSSASRTEVTAYHDNLALWTLGQIASVTVGSVLPTETTFNSIALPTVFKQFGKIKQTLTYNADATVATVKDGNNNVTALSSWYRAIPRTVTFPDSTTQVAVVSPAGWVTKLTDQNGFATNYTHDGMGRVTGVTYPTGDSVAWTSTTQTLATLASAELGMPIGSTRQTISTGNARRVTYLDGLWRPVLVYEYDAANEASTKRFKRFAYDYAGRPTFAGYASNTHTVGNGTLTIYDKLGRVESVTDDSELGDLTTTTQYLADFKTTTTRPGGAQTTVSYMAWDKPSYELARSISHPEGAITDVVRDTFGKPVSMTRRNSASTVSAVRRFVYDSHQQVCKQIEPENGSSIFAYDGAGNLSWSATGQALPSTSSCDTASVAAGQKVTSTYDAFNRLLTLSFPDALGNQTWSYTPDGLPSSIVTQNGAHTVTNSYTYNRRRMPLNETLAFGTTTYTALNTYNAGGHLSQLTVNGTPIAYSPNALGQPTRAGDFATSVSYHPDGSVKQYTYGNGIVRNVTQNARLLASRITDSTAGSLPVDIGYTYDNRGNVKSSTGYTPAARQTRSMTYDSLDRLTAVTSPMFTSAAYTYDILDNIKTLKVTGGSQVRDHTYVYSAAQRLTQINQTVGGAVVSTFGYDARGNVSSKNGASYVFDFGNRLRSSSGTVTYFYDGHGRRVRDDAGGAKNSFYDRNGDLLYTNNARVGVESYYIYLQGSIVAISELYWGAGTQIKYQHTDAQGTPISVTNPARTVLQTSEYEPFGRLANRAITDGPGYTGHVQDAATSLTYMQQRYYDPVVGRFLSVDPVKADEANGSNFNRYWYGNNNPYLFIDPDGRESCDTGSMCSHPGIPQSAVQGGIGEVPTMADINTAASAEPRTSTGGGVLTYASDQLMNKVLPAMGPAEMLVGGGLKLAGGGLKWAGGGLLVVRMGWHGESRVRAVYNIGPKNLFMIGSRVRMPDGMTLRTLSEVKNVSHLSLTSQLRDYANYAQSTGRLFHLYTRPNTTLSAPLAQEIAAGRIIQRHIP